LCGILGAITGNTSKTFRFSVHGETFEILTIYLSSGIKKPMIYPVKLLGFVVITAGQIFKMQNGKGKVVFTAN